jgi:hypothetical protein
MYHTIEFVLDFTADLEVSPKKPLEQVRIEAGTRRSAQIKPYVVETTQGPVEVADLFFDDGTTTRMVAFSCFTLVD